MTAKSYGTTPTNVQVIAPSTLSAGYTFEASYNGVTFPVVVPEGGVTKGQRFIVPFAPPTAEAVAVDASSIPVGAWRDSLWNCCAFGPCHPHFLNGWFCRSLLIGQLLTRMKMTWLGRREVVEGSVNDSRASVDEGWRSTFRTLVILTVSFYVLMGVTTTPQTMDPGFSVVDDKEQQQQQPEYLTYDDLSDIDKIKYTLNGWISTAFSLYIIYILAKLRATMRRTYSIPEESCLCCYQLGICGNNPREGMQCCGRSIGNDDDIPIGWEDVCCSIWCPMCITAQMARHTVDYRERRGACCNDVGVYGWDEDDAYVGLEGGVGEGALLAV